MAACDSAFAQDAIPAAPTTLPAAGAVDLPPADLITLTFPDNVELKVLIEYVSDRLGINVLYDEQAINQRVTLKTPARVPKSSLLPLLESALKMKGLALVEGDQPGWRRVVQANNLVAAATETTTTTRPSTDAADVMDRPSRIVTQVFTLRYADTTKADTAVKPFLTQPGGNSLPLPDQKLLVVTDFASNVDRVAQLIELVDRPQRPTVVEFLSVRHVDAQQLAGQLNQLLAAKGKQAGTSGGGANAAGTSIEVVQDPRTNRLALVGSAEAVKDATEFAVQLDVPLDVETRFYPFKAASPERIDRLAREMARPADATAGSSSSRPYVSVVDKESNLLIVTTTPQLHEQVRLLAERLDVPVPVEQSPVRMYKLMNTTAADVLETIKAIEGGGGAFDQTGDSSTAGSAGPTTSPAGGSSADRWPPPANPGIARPGAPGSAIPLPHQRQPLNGLTGDAGFSTQTPRTSVQARGATVTSDPNTNSIIVVGPPDTQAFYEQMIRSLDRRRPQVLVECTIVALDTSDNRSFGVELGGLGTSGSTNIVNFSSFGLSTPNPSTGQLALIPGLCFNGAIVNPDVGTVIIRALQTSGHAEVFSAPRILVADNATGTLSSIAESPFTSVNAGDTVATTSFGGYASAGTTITVTPHISEADHLQLEYAVALNNFTGEGADGIPPPRQTDAIESQVTIPDGQMIVVGGLNRRSFNRTVATIPILGDIPFLRWAFGNRSRNEQTTTLFVFLRPVILRDDQFADLKYYSKRDAHLAKISDGFPTSEPVLID